MKTLEYYYLKTSDVRGISVSFDDRSSIETYWARRQAGNNTAVSKKARLPKRTVPTRDHHSRSKRSRR
ncbi:hypothetical protein G6F38_012942 [Rhizopus arrhizus]|nr:hypothetical protein G6F38_012942 [Rhizopus arrhizus]